MYSWKEQFRTFLSDLARRGVIATSPHYEMMEPGSDDRLVARIYTVTNQYTISATETYLGCIAQARTARPGEDWQRGNDLADGPFGARTFTLILMDIVGYELLPIVERALVMSTPGGHCGPNYQEIGGSEL